MFRYRIPPRRSSKDAENATRCPSCRYPITTEFKVCPECGFSLTAPAVIRYLGRRHRRRLFLLSLAGVTVLLLISAVTFRGTIRDLCRLPSTVLFWVLQRNGIAQDFAKEKLVERAKNEELGREQIDQLVEYYGNRAREGGKEERTEALGVLLELHAVGIDEATDVLFSLRDSATTDVEKRKIDMLIMGFTKYNDRN